MLYLCWIWVCTPLLGSWKPHVLSTVLISPGYCFSPVQVLLRKDKMFWSLACKTVGREERKGSLTLSHKRKNWRSVGRVSGGCGYDISEARKRLHGVSSLHISWTVSLALPTSMWASGLDQGSRPGFAEMGLVIPSLFSTGNWVCEAVPHGWLRKKHSIPLYGTRAFPAGG